MSSLEANIVNPHDHDVLSGRGNFVNYHAGNEHFRGLVRKHKVAYVACPKPQKGKFSRMIVDEIRSRNPPGRFLKQDAATKLWYDIGEKKSLDKTRQALREGAPEIVKELSPDGEDSGGEDEDSEYPNSPRASISSHSQQVRSFRMESRILVLLVGTTNRGTSARFSSNNNTFAGDLHPHLPCFRLFLGDPATRVRALVDSNQCRASQRSWK
jgi:hypothetical protein